MRTRSPSSAPPLNGEVGSTARMPIRSPAARYAAASAQATVDLPTPGEPVRPITRAVPVSGAMAFMTARSSGERFSTREISRASARASPERAPAMRASGSAGARCRRRRWSSAAPGGRGSATARRRHLEQQRISLAAAAAERRRAEPAAPAAQLADQVQRYPRPRGADRVADRDGAAVDVDPVRADAEVAHRLDGDGGERLVDLDQVQVGHRAPGLAERVPDGPGRLGLQ